MNPAAVPVLSTISCGSTCVTSASMMRASSPSSSSVVSVRCTGQSRRPRATTASASRVTALAWMTRLPWAAVPLAVSLTQMSAFSPVCSR